MDPNDIIKVVGEAIGREVKQLRAEIRKLRSEVAVLKQCESMRSNRELTHGGDDE